MGTFALMSEKFWNGPEARNLYLNSQHFHTLRDNSLAHLASPLPQIVDQDVVPSLIPNTCQYLKFPDRSLRLSNPQEIVPI
jgi:hypothetical protein